MSHISDLITNGEIKIEENPCSSKTSSVWNHIALLKYNLSGEYTGYVFCKDCKTPLKHQRSTSGTTHLRNHIQKCGDKNANGGSGSGTQTKISSFLKKNDTIPSTLKDKLKDAAVSFVAEDLRPFNAFGGSGFLKLANALIDVGARCGKVDASQALPSRFTVRRSLDSKWKEAKENLTISIKTALDENGLIGITTDMWTDLKSRHFVSIIVHFVAELQLKARVLAVYEFKDDKKTGENIRRSLEGTFKEINIPVNVLAQKCIFVTDQGSNIRVALSTYKRIPCVCHMISTILKHTLQLEKMSSVEKTSDEDANMFYVHQIQNTVSNVKSVTAFFKRSGKNNNLSVGLKQCNDTRWNSTLAMLKSYKISAAEVEKILKENDEEERIADIDNAVIDLLIDFLEPFEQASSFFEGDRYPTIHRVYLWFKKLQRLMLPAPTDSRVLEFLKCRALACLKAKFEISEIHYLGLFFYPKFKALIPLTEIDRQHILHYAETMLLNCFPMAQIEHAADHGYAQPPGKKPRRPRRHIDDEFLDWQNEPEHQDAEEVSEVITYFNTTLDSAAVDSFDEQGDFNILKFWQSAEMKKRFPRLSSLALGILSVPASSASSERAFSGCGNLISKKRAQLSSSTVNAIMMLNSAKSERK